MSKFKVGDRVRIVRSSNGLVGKEATVIGVQANPLFWSGIVSDIGYRLNVDGIGEWLNGRFAIGAPPWALAPLINPDEQAWAQFKSLHLKPDPALILAKEPA